MGVHSGFLLLALLVGSLAIPTPENGISHEDLFYHTDPTARIVGGTVAAEGSAPHMVGLSSGLLIRSFLCGGSLISSRTVLTAAHCIDAVYSFGSLSSTLRGTVGTNLWNIGGQSYVFARNVTHQNYVSATIKNDIGLLITESEVVLSQAVQPITLSFAYVPAGVVARATGWGRIRQGGALSSALLELSVTTVDGQECADLIRALFANPPVEPHIELCTFHSTGHGMCNGDSGSALVAVDSQLQIGIVSWGVPCARGSPDMFVRVSAYVDWLAEHAV